MDSGPFFRIFLLIAVLFQVGTSVVRIDPRTNNDVRTPSPPSSGEIDEERHNENQDTSTQVERSPKNFMESSFRGDPKGPHFIASSPKTVTAAVGSPAIIPCKVRNLGSKSVSFIRHRDLHVLTVGSFTFTNDGRFSAHRDQSTGDWVLVLRHPQPKDSGKYECSISTKPVTSHTIHMNVEVPTAELLHKNENVYLDQGSTLNLTCVVSPSPTEPEFILWYHKDKLVDYRQKGREISVSTFHEGQTTHSSLIIHNATMTDSGMYSCKPANANKSTVQVHVLKSETPAAMQTTTTDSATALYSPIGLTLFSILIWTHFSSCTLLGCLFAAKPQTDFNMR